MGSRDRVRAMMLRIRKSDTPSTVRNAVVRKEGGRTGGADAVGNGYPLSSSSGHTPCNAV